jgi:hypothetical protein
MESGAFGLSAPLEIMKSPAWEFCHVMLSCLGVEIAGAENGVDRAFLVLSVGPALAARKEGPKHLLPDRRSSI